MISRDEFVRFIQDVEGCNVPDNLYKLYMQVNVELLIDLIENQRILVDP